MRALLLLSLISFLAADDAPWALRGRLPGDTTASTLLIAEGRIVEVLRGPAPAGYVERGADTLAIYPLWIDAHAPWPLDFPDAARFDDLGPDKRDSAPARSEPANRAGLYPQRASWQALTRDGEAWGKRLRDGTGLVLAAPEDGIVAGRGAVLDLLAPDLRAAVVATPDDFYGDLQWRNDGYPSTTMGAQAQLRQFCADLRRHAELPEPRPFEPALREGGALLSGSRLWLRASSADAIDRALRCAGELSLSIGLLGASDAWRLADVLAARQVPVILRLDQGDAPQRPKDPPPWSRPAEAYEEAHAAWQAEVACAARLAEAGVPFALSTRGLKPGQLVDRLTRLVEHGLAEEDLVRALTTTPAHWLGLDFLPDEPFAPGSLAAFTVCERPLGADKNRVRMVVFGSRSQDFGGK